MSFNAPPGPPAPPQHPYPAQAHPGQPHPGYPGPPPGVPVLRSPQALAIALTVLLSIAAVVNLLSAATGVYLFSLMQRLLTDPSKVADATLDRADDLTTLAGGLQRLTLLATAVVFIIWFHRVRVNGETFQPDAFDQTRGWAIGSWFVPVGNLFIPFRIAKQIWNASTQWGPDGSYRHVSTAPIGAWWAMWIASLLFHLLFNQRYTRAETPEALRDAATVGAVADVLTVAAAVLAILFVRRLTAMQAVKAAQGPYAAV
ncbi:DUF4328 domain-containing protein [Streptomyces sp. NPDC006430]|uniref:DUF4328 domain-containing protein n=1 Tax=Streptomyces sp. NPDC006430 TaxID=3154299 RepID=UPI0033AC0AED